jgi:HD superfamily phosphodiesterase
MSLITNLINFIIYTCSIYNIDESHGLSHSLNVLNYAKKIYDSEIPKNPDLIKQERIIIISALLHDMCDKKYMDETTGVRNIHNFLNDKIEFSEIEMIKKIISTMSYSKVKKNGFPDFGDYQLAYHIVREADLLTAYDFDRCMIYNTHKNNKCSILDSFNDASELFERRMLKHNEDNLFVTDYSKKESVHLHTLSLNRIESWKKILRNPLI